MRVFFLVLLCGMFDTVWSASERWGDNTHLLPAYCKARVNGIADPKWSKWRRVFGEVHIHMHHYCEGIFSEMKARSAMDSQRRQGYLHNVVHQMEYVGNACQVGCVVYAELHKRWGWALGEQAKAGEAIQHYKLSIKAKPDYVAAYAGLAEVYVDIDQPEEATKVLEEGLRVAPESTLLKRRLRKLSESP